MNESFVRGFEKIALNKGEALLLGSGAAALLATSAALMGGGEGLASGMEDVSQGDVGKGYAKAVGASALGGVLSGIFPAWLAANVAGGSFLKNLKIYSKNIIPKAALIGLAGAGAAHALGTTESK